MIGADSIQSRGLLRYKGFPVKVYAFAHDFSRLYGTTEGALRHVSDVITKHPQILVDPYGNFKRLYGIAFPWGEARSMARKDLELSVFAFDKPWDECNPEVYTYTFANGAMTARDDKFCGTGHIILGREEELRRKLASAGMNLEHYVNQFHPELLTYLGPRDQMVVELKVD